MPATRAEPATQATQAAESERAELVGRVIDLEVRAAQAACYGVLLLLIPVYTYEHHLVFAIPAMVLALHATHLLVGTHGASRGTAVMSLPLLQATVTRGGVLAGHPLAAGLDVPADDGLTISGFPGTEGRPGTYFVGLGPGAADACFEAVRAAVARAKNAPP